MDITIRALPITLAGDGNGHTVTPPAGYRIIQVLPNAVPPRYLRMMCVLEPDIPRRVTPAAVDLVAGMWESEADDNEQNLPETQLERQMTLMEIRTLRMCASQVRAAAVAAAVESASSLLVCDKPEDCPNGPDGHVFRPLDAEPASTVMGCCWQDWESLRRSAEWPPFTAVPRLRRLGEDNER